MASAALSDQRTHTGELLCMDVCPPRAVSVVNVSWPFNVLVSQPETQRAMPATSM
jgi:hypothetical protein